LIFLLKDNFGILKLYGGARRNHGGVGRSCLNNISGKKKGSELHHPEAKLMYKKDLQIM